jgi:tripartite-type tricarboxylate transporter receptor subunit TctC
MGIVLAFAFGYVVGANTGHESYQELLEALRAVQQSDEFHGLVAAARGHVSASLRQLADLVEDKPDGDASPVRLLERVRTIMARAPISPAS